MRHCFPHCSFHAQGFLDSRSVEHGPSTGRHELARARRAPSIIKRITEAPALLPAVVSLSLYDGVVIRGLVPSAYSGNLSPRIQVALCEMEEMMHGMPGNPSAASAHAPPAAASAPAAAAAAAADDEEEDALDAFMAGIEADLKKPPPPPSAAAAATAAGGGGAADDDEDDDMLSFIEARRRAGKGPSGGGAGGGGGGGDSDDEVYAVWALACLCFFSGCVVDQSVLDSISRTFAPGRSSVAYSTPSAPSIASLHRLPKGGAGGRGGGWVRIRGKRRRPRETLGRVRAAPPFYSLC